MPVSVTALSANSAQCDQYEYKLRMLTNEWNCQYQRASETALGFGHGPVWEEEAYDLRRSPSQKGFHPHHVQSPESCFCFQSWHYLAGQTSDIQFHVRGRLSPPGVTQVAAQVRLVLSLDTFSASFMVWPRRGESEDRLHLELYPRHWKTSSPSTFLPAASTHCLKLF